jgi:hypothetical protein
VDKQFPEDQYALFLFWLTAEKSIRFDRVVSRGEPGDTREFLEHVEQTVPNPWPLKILRGHMEQIDNNNMNTEPVAQLMFDRHAMAQRIS